MDFEEIAERICRQMDVFVAAGNSESVSHLLRDALLQIRDGAVSKTLSACLSIVDEEAERAHVVGSVGGEQTALIIAARIRKQF